MSKLHFTDGVSIDASGPYRVIRKADGYYVVGRGLCVPVATQADGERILRELPMDERDKALTILAGCPTGATELTLANHGISRATLDALVAEGLITHTVTVMANPRGLKVDRFELKASD